MARIATRMGRDRRLASPTDNPPLNLLLTRFIALYPLYDFPAFSPCIRSYE